MRVSLKGPKLTDPMAPKMTLLKPPSMRKPIAGRVSSLRKPSGKGFNPQPGGTNMFGTRAMKTPEDYATEESVEGLGKTVSPYFSAQYAKKGRQLRYDTATQTYR